MISRKRISVFLTLLAFVNFSEALNFGKVKLFNYGRVASPQPVKNVTTPKPASQRPVNLVTPRKFPGPFTIIYPLTFTSNAKSVNLTFKPEPPPTDEVQSRIMNNPQPYPVFTYETEKPDKPVEIVYEQPIPPPTSEEIDYSKNPSFVPRFQYGQQDIPPTYKGLEYISYRPPFRPNNTKLTTSGDLSERVLFPGPPGYIKNSKVPKPKLPPLQVYNKATVVATPPPDDKQQQWESCYCVPYYLCKNGVLSSGGRQRALQKRSLKSYGIPYKPYVNKTFSPFPIPSKIVNIPRLSRDDTCEQGKVCCQLNLSENTADDEDNENYYPVATPAPAPKYPAYPAPPRFPDQDKQYKVCGSRSAYGVQTRLKQLRYTKDVAEFGEYPWQVAVLKKNVGDKNLYLCGGVLIKPQWVATVAHCIKKDQNSPLTIRLGEWDVNRKDEVYPYMEKDVNSIVIHPDFDPESLENDIALIKMKDPVDPRVPHITPACIPEPAQIYEGQKCWVSGWGKDFFGPQGEYQNVLKEVDVPVVSRALCNTELRSTNLGPKFVLHPGFLCAGGEAGKDACTGDGGSPLVCKSEGLWYVVGLVSWGIGCGQPGVPGVYVNVLYYADWINSASRR